MPLKWNDLFKMLKNTKQNSSGGWTPSLPLILAGWEHTVPLQKYFGISRAYPMASDQ